MFSFSILFMENAGIFLTSIKYSFNVVMSSVIGISLILYNFLSVNPFVNLIPANPVKENSFSRPNDNKVHRFCELMKSKGINTTVRRTLGSDIDASCGQLRHQAQKGGNAN